MSSPLLNINSKFLFYETTEYDSKVVIIKEEVTKNISNIDNYNSDNQKLSATMIANRKIYDCDKKNCKYSASFCFSQEIAFIKRVNICPT